MRRIASETINEINSKADIVSLIGEYVQLKHKGNEYWGCCPFHTEKTPSFAVSPSKRIYHCFGCGKGGSIISFLMEAEKISFTEAVENLAKKFSIEIIYEGGNFVEDKHAEEKRRLKDDLLDLYKRVANMYHFFLTETKQGEKALQYLQKRGVSKEIIENFSLGFSPNDRRWLKKFLKEKNYSDSFLEDSGLFSKNYPDVSFFSNRVMFPITNRNGAVVAFGARLLEGEGPKYLNSGELPQYKKRETLYAFSQAKEFIRQNKAVIFCEGYMDVLAYHQAGIKYAVAPLGTALTEEQVQVIKPFVDTVYLSFDTDNAGQNATFKAIVMCRKVNLSVKIIDISSFSQKNGGVFCKDPADVLLNYGAETLTNITKDSKLDADYLLSRLAKQYPVGDLEGKTKAMLSFFPFIDALQSDVQKQLCFEQLCQKFELKLESVLQDYNNRDLALKRIKKSENISSVNKEKSIKKSAELRVMLAVVSNTDLYKSIRSLVTAEDFEDTAARDLFFILEECFREGAISYDSVLLKCSNEALKNVICATIASQEFGINTEKIIEDGIKLIRRNSLERKRGRLMNKIRSLSGGNSLEELQELQSLQYEIIQIDNELNL